MARLAHAQRYEQAATVRQRLTALLRACVRQQRRTSLIRIAHLAAARPAGGGWELAVVRHGRLAGAGYAPPRTPPRQVLAQGVATAETVTGGQGPTRAPPPGDRPDPGLAGAPETRLVEASGGWAYPVQEPAGSSNFWLTWRPPAIYWPNGDFPAYWT